MSTKITIKTLQYPADASGDTEALEETIVEQGTFREKNGSYFIFYEQKDPDTGLITGNRIKAEPDGTVTRTHKGQCSSEMRFVKGIETKTNYVTPYGTFPMSFMTTHVGTQHEKAYFRLSLEYILSVDNVPTSNCQIEIEVDI